jgi:hypothetical protein
MPHYKSPALQKQYKITQHLNYNTNTKLQTTNITKPIQTYKSNTFQRGAAKALVRPP